MQEFNADFHLHGPHSIGVSKNMNLDNLVIGAKQKGLQVVGTGDCLHPTWLSYLKANLEEINGEFRYKGVKFILQTEVEDKESVHHVILLPDLDSIEELRKKFKPHSKNIDGEWGGRPSVRLSPEEIVELVNDVNGLIGPAHAFTPFKSIFRQGKFNRLRDAYGSRVKNVHFIELGLSANTDYADRIKELHRLTFLSNSDAHSPTPQSLGREFNTFLAESAHFDEIVLAIKRKDGRKFIRNVGMDPKLGKYNVLFCKACRRRVIVKIAREKASKSQGILNKIWYDDDLIHVIVPSKESYVDYLKAINDGKITCPACKASKKNSKIKLGVSERVKLLADLPKGSHPSHRPPYINAIPLTEILRVAMGIKSKSSKILQRAYVSLVDKYGPEIDILLKKNLEELNDNDIQKDFKKYPKLLSNISEIIGCFRENTINFKPGGGGKFGELVFEL
ncbi:MAG: endonuclease Q family protein [Promethearchaeota archaeon]